MKDNAYAALVSANTNIEAGWLYIPAGFRLRLVRPSPLATSGDQPGSVVVAPRRRFDVGPPFVGQEPPTRSTEELLVC